MKKTLIGILAGAALTLGATAAQASAFLNIDVGGTSVSCNTTLAVSATNCGAGFSFLTNVINFAGTVNGVSFGNIVGEVVQGNQLTGVATASASGNNIFNSSGASRLVTVSFALNDFTLPPGTPVNFNATQAVTNIQGPAVTGNFTGWGTGLNGLVPGVGSNSITPACVTVASPATNSCSTNGPVNSFARSGPFGLNGIQSFTLANNGNVNVQASIVTQAVPEPASMILLGTGLVGLARTARRRQRSR